MDADAGDASTASLHLAGVETGTHVQAKRSQAFPEPKRAANGARRAVEGCEQPVTREVEDRSAEPRDFGRRQLVVSLEQLPPPRVAQLDRPWSGIDDVGP